MGCTAVLWTSSELPISDGLQVCCNKHGLRCSHVKLWCLRRIYWASNTRCSDAVCGSPLVCQHLMLMLSCQVSDGARLSIFNLHSSGLPVSISVVLDCGMLLVCRFHVEVLMRWALPSRRSLVEVRMRMGSTVSALLSRASRRSWQSRR